MLRGKYHIRILEEIFTIHDSLLIMMYSLAHKLPTKQQHLKTIKIVIVIKKKKKNTFLKHIKRNRPQYPGDLRKVQIFVMILKSDEVLGRIHAQI